MDIVGSYKIHLVGQTFIVQANIVRVIVDSLGHPLWLIDKDDTVYNWQNIMMLTKVR